MKCEHVRESIEQHLEGRLLPIDKAAVMLHLDGCADCSREVVRARSLVAALEALPDPPMPSEFVRSVMQQLPEMLPAKEGAGHVLRWGLVAAAACFAFLAALGLLLQGGGPDVAHEVLDPLAASFRLAGLLLGQGATLVAAVLDAASVALVETDYGAKLAFAALLVATYAALLAMLSRLRPARSGAHAPPGR